MSIGVIVGLLVSAAIIAVAWAIGRMSRPGPVYPRPAVDAEDSSAANNAAMVTMIASTASFSAGDGGASCSSGSSGGHC